MTDTKKIVRDFQKDFRQIENKIIPLIKKYINKDGMSVNDAMRKAMNVSGFSNKLEGIILDKVTATTMLSLDINEKKFKEWYKTNKFLDEEFTLSQKVMRAEERVIRDASALLNRSINSGNSWKRITKKLTDLEYDNLPAMKENISQNIKELEDLTRKQFLTATQKKKYSKEINKFKKSIREASERTATSKSFKKSKERLLKAIKSGNEESINNALDDVRKKKMRYNASRIARTEIQKTDTAAQQTVIDEDDDVEAYRIVLSDNRPADFSDQCDFHAESDMYGLGKGVYPKKVPILKPFHPNCMCRISKVFITKNDPEYNPKKGNEWMRQNPEKANKILHKKDRDKKNVEGFDWRKYARNTKDPEKALRYKIPKSVLKKEK